MNDTNNFNSVCAEGLAAIITKAEHDDSMNMRQSIRPFLCVVNPNSPVFSWFCYDNLVY